MRGMKAAFILALLVSASALGAETERDFEGEVVSVAVFKNGYGFFRVEGEAELEKGEVDISPVPAAALGTWWFYTRADGAVIERAVAGQKDKEIIRTPYSIEEVLAANAGRKANVETDEGGYVGVIVAPPPREEPTAEEMRRGYYRNQPPPDIVLKTDDGIVVLRRSDIRVVTVWEGSEEYTKTEKEGYVTLTVKNAPDGAIQVGCQYLQRGIRWIPSYRLELIDDETASLALQAEVINDIRDLEGSTLQLVVGIPNFMWGELLSPLAYVSEMPKLSGFFPQAEDRDRRNERYFSNSIMSQSVRGGAFGGTSVLETMAAPMPDAFTADRGVMSKGVSDLFYYTKEDVTLQSGERASLTLLSGDVPYEHIYKWDVPDQNLKYRREYRDIYDRWARGDYSRNQNIAPEVARKVELMTRQSVAEHYVRLTNTTDKPLTSGPALLFDKGDVLAQDLVLYTPAGGKLDVRITGAPDIKVSQKETEKSRSRNALRHSGRDHDLVGVATSLTVKNFKKETIRMVVTKEFDGTLEATPDGATAVQDTSELVSVNPHTRVEWEFDFEPDEEKELNLSYAIYVSERY